jgi:uncharacterized protein (TIGR00369 family)
MSTLPPYAALLGVVVADDDLVMPFAPAVSGRPAFVHGGALAGLLEIAARRAIAAALAGQGTPELLTMTTEYWRGGRERDTRATAEVTRLGNRIAQVTARAWQNSADQPIAVAHLTFRVIRP